LLISIITPCFNEEKNINLYSKAIEEINQWVRKTKNELEVLIIDDCSLDNSWKEIKKLSKQKKYIKIYKNKINRGVYRTTYSLFKKVNGDIVVPMFPMDLQDPPSVLIEILKVKFKKNCAAVMGLKTKREESALLEFSRNLFYRILEKTYNEKILKNVGEFGAVDRWIIDEMANRNDYYPFMRSMIQKLTSDIHLVEYTWKHRVEGKSNYSFWSYYDHAMNAIVSNGGNIFRGILALGFVFSFLSLTFAMINLILYFLNFNETISGIPTIVILTSLINGFVMIMLGFMGELLISINNQVRNTYLHETIEEDNNL